MLILIKWIRIAEPASVLPDYLFTASFFAGPAKSHFPFTLH